MSHYLSLDTVHRSRQPTFGRIGHGIESSRIGLAPAALVGNTPVLRISAPLTSADRGFWAKLEGSNPGGSMKDRPALHTVQRARLRGQLRPVASIKPGDGSACPAAIQSTGRAAR